MIPHLESVQESPYPSQRRQEKRPAKRPAAKEALQEPLPEKRDPASKAPTRLIGQHVDKEA